MLLNNGNILLFRMSYLLINNQQLCLVIKVNIHAFLMRMYAK